MPERTVEATSSTKDKDYIPIAKYTKPARIGPKDVRAPTKNELTDKQRQALAALKQTNQPRAPLRAAPVSKGQAARVAPRIELMKLKAKATGNPNMAMEDRLYLSVASEAKTIVVFINKVYSLQVAASGEILSPGDTFDQLLVARSDTTFFNGCKLALIG
ncbi:hypothetical protein EC988_001649 [Linderina pennispora]|nr:hypothetical protein EC988_001649 [Linderina pennispora]